jgi:hypothetical protein
MNQRAIIAEGITIPQPPPAWLIESRAGFILVDDSNPDCPWYSGQSPRPQALTPESAIERDGYDPATSDGSPVHGSCCDPARRAN